MGISIPRAKTPEEVGVSSAAIRNFLNEIEYRNVNIHSFMVIRHGKVACECFRAPYTPERPHAMYSVSKTITATAVGIAVGEGLIRLDDKVKDYFPDYCEGRQDLKLNNLTVEDLVSMKSGKNPDLLTDKSKVDWILSYFDAPWYANPGEKYRYINENMYMLCALLTRATGMSVRKYLTPRLFEPLGIDVPFWETDSYGIEAGGWGIYLRTEDLAKIMLCYAQGGVFEGKQIIPADWVAAATQSQSDSSKNGDLDASVGYCYGMWRCGGANAYRADGMFSQFGIVFEDFDAVVVITAGIAVEQEGRDFVWKHFPSAFIDENRKSQKNTFVEGLDKALASAVLEKPKASAHSPMEMYIEGREIKMRKKLLLNLVGLQLSVLPIPITYMTTDKAGNIDRIVFSFRDTECSFRWSEGDETNTVLCGMDGHFRYGIMRLGQIDYTVCCNAEWLDTDRLQINIRPIETIAKRRLDFKFRGNSVTMKPSGDPSIESLAAFLGRSLRDNFASDFMKDAITAIMALIPGILEPKHKGRFIS